MKTIAGLKLYDVPEISKLLSVSTKTVLKFIGEGQLVGRKIGKGYFVTEEKLRAFIENAEEVQEDDDDAEELNHVMASVQGQRAPSAEHPYVTLEQNPSPTRASNTWDAGVVIKLETPYFMVSTEGTLIPLRDDGTVIWDKDQDALEEAMAAATGEWASGDDEEEGEEADDDDADA